MALGWTLSASVYRDHNLNSIKWWFEISWRISYSHFFYLPTRVRKSQYPGEIRDSSERISWRTTAECDGPSEASDRYVCRCTARITQNQSCVSKTDTPARLTMGHLDLLVFAVFDTCIKYKDVSLFQKLTLMLLSWCCLISKQLWGSGDFDPSFASSALLSYGCILLTLTKEMLSQSHCLCSSTLLCPPGKNAPFSRQPPNLSVMFIAVQMQNQNSKKKKNSWGWKPLKTHLVIKSCLIWTHLLANSDIAWTWVSL